MKMNHITELFNIEDCTKDLLFNSATKEQEKASRSFLNRVREDIKTIYIPSEIKDM